jgi:hypothetical protein
MFKRIRIRHALPLVLLGMLGMIAISVMTIAQTPNPTGPVMRFTATTANVSGAPDSVRIDVLAWSTDADRDQMVGAWNLTAVPAAANARGAAGAGAGGRGGGAGAGARGGRGGGADAPANAPDAAAGANAPEAAPAAGAGRGGRGGGRGGAAAAAADTTPRTPESALAATLQAARTVGYIWTSESAGYSLRYAYRLPQPDGGERIIFATDRRLGAWNDLWKPTGGATPTAYEFTVIEVHLSPKGVGEAKTSLTGKVTIDASAKTIALDGYSALPVVFKDVKRNTSK